MTKQNILNYFRGWASTTDNKTSGLNFVQMLQEKTYFAKHNSVEVMANGQMRTGEELEAMLIIADDLLTAEELV